jgi:hypothetical protein
LKNKDRVAAHGAAIWGARDILITAKVTEEHNRVQQAYLQIGVKI